jgi:hypothetical protein
MTAWKKIAAATFPTDSRLARVISETRTPGDYRNLGLALSLVLGGPDATGVSGSLLFRRRKARKTN